MTLTRRSLATVAVLITLSPLLLGSSDLREDQFECEQAVAHLRECCPSTFDPTAVSCEFEPGCGGGGTYPGLTVDDSKCIERKSCDQIRTSTLCADTEGRSSRPDPATAATGVPARVCR